MKKTAFLVTLFLAVIAQAGAQGQYDSATGVLATNLKNLIARNTGKDAVKDLRYLSGLAYYNLTAHITQKQVIAITAPYLASKELVAKDICLSLLGDPLVKKTASPAEKQELVEIICHNYLDTAEIQRAGALLLRLKATDFNRAAKKSIAALLSTIGDYPDYDLRALLLGMAQIKTAIPVLWKLVHTDVANPQQADVRILASLARMGETKAGALLCRYYSSKKNASDYKQIFAAVELSFSMDKAVLDCLVNDFKTMDMNKEFKDGDTGYYPAMYIGQHICDMLKNYPYPSGVQLNPQQLLDWLKKTPHYKLGER